MIPPTRFLLRATRRATFKSFVRLSLFNITICSPRFRNQPPIRFLPTASITTTQFNIPSEVPPVSGQIYHLSVPKLAALKAWLEDHLQKGFIRPSKSPFGAPVLLVPKSDGSLRPCCDYRLLNSITVKDKTPLPLISESFDRLSSAKIFSKLDLRGAFNLLRIAPGQEHYTAFRTRYGLYECLVMPFGLTNAPGSFQRLMNTVLHDLLDVTCIVYLDDIIVFSDNMSDHVNHCRQVLERLVENHLYVKAEKCEFGVESTTFLGHVISTAGISMDPTRIRTILDWPAPTSLKQLFKFMGFANAYRRYISDYATVTAPLNRLTTKLAVSQPFHLDEAALEAFHSLKSRFTSPPLLRHFDQSRPTVIETDSSGFAIAAIMSQAHPTTANPRRLLPVAFFSRKMTAAERNYGIRDQELLALVEAIRYWSDYLESCSEPFTILTDHQTLQHFRKATTLTARQVRWSADVNHHKYFIKYRPARLNAKADALSRREDWEAEASNLPQPVLPVIRPVQSITPIGLTAIVTESEGEGRHDNIVQGAEGGLEDVDKGPAGVPPTGPVQGESIETPMVVQPTGAAPKKVRFTHPSQPARERICPNSDADSGALIESVRGPTLSPPADVIFTTTSAASTTRR